MLSELLTVYFITILNLAFSLPRLKKKIGLNVIVTYAKHVKCIRSTNELNVECNYDLQKKAWQLLFTVWRYV